jgi:hypothetical protein
MQHFQVGHNLEEYKFSPQKHLKIPTIHPQIKPLQAQALQILE